MPANREASTARGRMMALAFSLLGAFLFVQCSSTDQASSANETAVHADAAAVDSARPVDATTDRQAPTDVQAEAEADAEAGPADAGPADAGPADAAASSTMPCVDALDAAVEVSIDCASTADCTSACEDFRGNYRAGIAQIAADCIKATPSCTTLDAMLCLDRAVARACPQDSAVAYCTDLRAICVDEHGDAAPADGPLPQAGCELFASAFSTTGEQAFAACIRSTTGDGGCPSESVQCAEEIRR